jgi:hypothetical protein
LPEPLIGLNSEQGARLLLESEANRAYWPLSIQFVTQKNQAYCGVASLTMVLNALGVPAPATPEFEPFKTFTQDNLLDEVIEKVLPKELLAKIGMTRSEGFRSPTRLRLMCGMLPIPAWMSFASWPLKP